VVKIDRPRALGRRRGIAISAATAVLAGSATHAPSAQAWSEPLTVATGANALLAPGVAWTKTGAGVLGWLTGAEDDVALATALPSTERFSSRGVYRPARRVYAGDNGNFAAYGRSGLAFGGVTAGNRIAVVLGRLGSSAGRRVTIGPRLQSGPTQLAANAAGDMAVVGLTQTRAGDLRTLAPTMVARRHGRFGRPIRLAGGSRHYTGAFDVAINGRGDVLIAWQRGRTMYARIRIAGGRPGPAVRLGRSGNAQISVWLAGDRSATVAWEARDLNATEVRAARALPGGHFLRRATLLEHFDGHIAAATCAGPSREAQLLRVAGARSGQPVVAWTARESGQLVVRAAMGSGRRKFRFTPLAYSPALNSCINAVAVSRDGSGTVLWSQSTRREGVVDLLAASQALPGGAYAAPDAVAEGAVPGAALTIDPISNRLVAAWATAEGEVRVSTSRPPSD
jgi:hypothetical protein